MLFWAFVALGALVAIMVVMAFMVVAFCIAVSLVAVSMVVVVVAAFFWAGVHGGHVIDRHLRAIPETLMAHGAG